MKKLLIPVFLFISNVLFGQDWVKNIPQEKIQNQNLTFFDVKNAFDTHYQPLGVVNGKIEVNGKLEKVPGWKQYKRWEWFWEQRVNQQTGAFPDGKAIDQLFNQQIRNSSKSSASNWVSMGPSSSTGGYAGIGRINCIAFHPTHSNTFWVGSPSGGLWKTTDGGSTWTVLTDANAVLGVSDIAIPSDYATSKTIYIATGDKDGGSMWSLGGGGYADNNSVGVLKSTDEGITWVATGLTYTVSQNKRIGRLLIHPTNNNIIFAATSNGIEKSTDAGATWNTVYNYTRQYYSDMVVDIEFKPGSTTDIYASTKEYGASPKLLKSSNTGSTWINIREFAITDNRIDIAVTAADADFIYVIISNQDGGLSGIYRSIDSGTSFVQLVDGSDPNKAFLGYYSDGSGENSGQGGYDLCIAASPNDKNLVLIGGINTWKTIDGGTTWNICNMWTSYSGYNFSGAPEVHADKHTLAFRDDGVLFEGNDGGIYKSTDNGLVWTDISNNLTISQIYRIGVSQTDANMVINGLQDNGSKLIDGGVWTDVTGGDGMECIIDYTDKNIQYATYVNGEIYRTDNLWATQTTISDNIGDADGGSWVTPYVIDKQNNATLYVGYADLWKTIDKGASFSKITNINSSDKLRSVAIAPSNSDYLYVADFSHIWKTADAGTNWNDITGSLPVTSNSITYICVKESDPLTLWISMGGYDSQRIFQSTDGGANWTNISTGLPNLPVMCVAQNKLNTIDVEIYAGTDLGVYVKSGLNDWELFSQGLPSVVVTELDMYYDPANAENSKIRAATYGRGLWESNLYTTGALAPVANFTATPTSTAVGQAVTFVDNSQHNPTTWEWIFDGGTPANSTQQNQQVIYDTAGTYNVTLIVANSAGADTLTRTAYITINPAEIPVAGFKADKTTAYITENIQFTDTSLNYPATWEWTFDGGKPNVSVEQNPIVSYDSAGVYNVSLIVTNSVGSDTLTHEGYITIAEPLLPVAGFYADTTTIFEGKKVQFTDTSLNYPSNWEWIFQGGTPSTSTQQHPLVTYNTPGIYDVSLIVSNNLGRDTLIKTAHIIVNEILIAAAKFSASPTSGSLPLKVTFNNTSENATHFSWDFGDGTTSLLKNPIHTYNEKGAYDIVLVASNSENSDTETKSAYIQVFMAKPVADFTADPTVGGFPLEVTFTNTSTSAVSFIWDFGDASTSTETSPVHIYQQAGDYSVSLIALNSDFADTLSKSNYITANWPDPVADFEANPVMGNDPLTVEFTDKSANAQTWLWSFGDGKNSIDQNPTHVFPKGVYNISLLVTNPSGNNSILKEKFINAGFVGVPDNYKDKLKVFPNPVTDKINIEFINEDYKKIVFAIYDTNGKLHKRLMPNNAYLIKEQIDISDLKSGNYILKINFDANIVVVGILKE